MKMNFLRRLALLCAVLTCGMLLALPAAAAEADAPYAEDGDMDYIRSYVVTVDPREDGSVDITYDIDWQVIDGDKTDYLSWVKIGLANSSVDELTPLTDTISDLQYTSDGGSYAKVVFRHRYYAPDVAAANGGESSVHFAFSVHQSHLFTKNDDGTANFAFTPGWFDDLSVENMQVRWHNYDGFVADNTGVDGDYLTWDFGVMGHGQQAMVHVTVPVTNAAAFDPGAAMTTDDYDSGEDLDEIIGILKQATEKYNFLYIEDPVDENDWEGWVKAAKALNRTTLCGDDLTVTNIDYLRKALDMGACGAFVFKPNQVGTVTEAMEAQRYAVDHGMFSIPSIRAGGVSDDPVADMGIAGGAAAVKLGPPKFGHAIHIINSLLRAETELPEAKPFDFSPFVKF